MNDIEIVWIDETNIIIKCIYNEHMPQNKLKLHMDRIAESEFFTVLKSKYNLVCVGCIRKQPDSHVTNNYISMHEDGTLDVSSENNVTVKLESDRKIFSVDTDSDKEEIEKVVSKFENSMRFITD
jgi:hypothetical protein